MSRTNEDNEISDEERLKKLEAKVDKVENLLTMNICFTFIGCMILGFLYYWQFNWPISENEFQLFTLIFMGFLGIYGILNVILLSKKDREAPKEHLWFEKEEINQKKNSV